MRALPQVGITFAFHIEEDEASLEKRARERDYIIRANSMGSIPH